MKHECELCKLPIRKCGHLRRVLLNGILFHACEGCKIKLMNPQLMMSKLSRKDILEKVSSGVKV